jgi:hypothetical protein
MGGILSTRWNFTPTKPTTDRYPRMDIRGRNRPPRRGCTSVTVRAGGVEQKIGVDWTPCVYGGERPWWRCPLCGRRVLVLYFRRCWGCRRCLRLTYRSQRQDRVARLDASARKLGRRVGIVDADARDLLSRWPRKPPRYMHRRTFRRLWEEACALDGAYEDAFLARVGPVLLRLGRLEERVSRLQR